MLIGKKLRAHIRDNQLRVDVLNIGFLGFINLAAMVVAPIYLSSIAWSWGPVICARASFALSTKSAGISSSTVPQSVYDDLTH